MIIHRGSLVPVVAVILSLCCGCEREVDTAYATVRGDSINGVSAFIQLLRDTGHVTMARQKLPSRIDPTARSVILFDDSFTTLNSEASEVLGDALAEDGLRTVLLILRDGDAVIEYLRDILSRGDLTDDVRKTAVSLLATAERTLKTANAEARLATPPFSDGLAPCDRPAGDGFTDVNVEGHDEQTVSITARWELRRRLDDPGIGQSLWQAGQEPLLVRQFDGSTEFLVLASAAPLLNGGLVDPGNRALAEHLVGLLPTTGQILVAGSSQVDHSDGADPSGDADGGDAAGEEPSSWRLLFVQPLPWLALQGIVAMGLFCWSTSPIFGRPRRSSPEHAQDFGHHVSALASMLTRSPDGAAFSWKRIEEWRSPSSAASRKSRRRRTL